VYSVSGSVRPLLVGAVALTALLFPCSAPASDLRLSGDVGRLFPGISQSMRVEVRNPGDRWVRLRWLQVSPTAGTGGCAAGNVIAGRQSTRLLVGPEQTKVASVPVRLRAGAPNSCQGVRFRLRLRAAASVMKASGSGGSGHRAEEAPPSSGAANAGGASPELGGGSMRPLVEAGSRTPPLEAATRSPGGARSPSAASGGRSDGDAPPPVGVASRGDLNPVLDLVALALTALLLAWAIRRHRAEETVS